MMQSSLAEKLRILRARRGLTVRDAAQKIGVDRHTLHRLEGGVGEPRYPTLHKIAKGYGVQIEDLLVEEEPALAGKAEASETGQGDAERIPAEAVDTMRQWEPGPPRKTTTYVPFAEDYLKQLTDPATGHEQALQIVFALSHRRSEEGVEYLRRIRARAVERLEDLLEHEIADPDARERAKARLMLLATALDLAEYGSVSLDKLRELDLAVVG